MLKKHIDMALVGKSYLSVLLSLNLLEQGQEVLLLDDDRIGVDDFYIDRIFSLDKEYLKYWGEEQDIEPLQNIDKYLTNVSSKVIFDDIHICLGDSPAQNYRELVRKMPEVFSCLDDMSVFKSAEEMEKFNDIYFEYCNNLGRRIYGYKNINVEDLHFLQKDCPSVLKNSYTSFENVFKNKKQDKYWWRLKTLLYILQGIFQKKLSLEPCPLERFHIFLCLLSPFYELDQRKFFEDLVEVNLQRGGQFKKTSIREWLFNKGKPWSVELASYEGIIHPKKMAFVGGIPCGNLVKLKPDVEHYVSLGIELDFSEDLLEDWWHERIIFSGMDKIGSFIPLWEGMFGKRKAFFKFVILAERGRKVDFVKSKVEAYLFEDLEKLIPRVSDIAKNMKIVYGRDVWIDKTKSVSTTNGSPIKLVDFSRPEKRTELNSVYYFGPYSETQLGSLGMLMEINRKQQFI